MAIGHLLTLSVLAGVATGVATPVRPTDALAVALALASLALAAAERRGALGRALVLLALASGAAAHGGVARECALAPPLAAWFDATAGPDARAAPPVRVRGVLLEDAATGEAGVRLAVRVGAVDGGRGWEPIRGRVQVHVTGALGAARAAEWTAGRAVEAPVLLRRPAVYRNPGGPSETWQKLRRPFDLAGTVKSAALVTVERGAWWHEAAAGVRRHVRDAARRYIAPRHPEAAAVVTAILIGDRAGLSEDLERRLQIAGTYHVIAISGGNVAMLTAACFFIVRSLVRSRRAVSLITLAVVAGYGWVVGADPSVERAVTAAAVYLLVDLAGLVPRALNVLGLVAASLVLIEPLLVIDVGAWLSFAATFGIVIGVPRIIAHVPVRSRMLRPVIVLCSATLAAELILLPIQAAVFHRITVAGLLLNIVAIPAMALVQAAGLVMTVCASWWPGGASVATDVAAWSTSILLGSASLMEIAPMLSWRVPPVTWVWSALYYAAWIGVLCCRTRPWRCTACAIATAAGIVIMTAPATPLARPAPPWLRVTLIDVGQGDAILLQFPSGHSMLVDTGGTPGAFDIGSRIVTPAAWALGVRRLDWLVITHGDNDHIGGALSVIDDLRPREVWEGVPVARAEALQTLQRRATAHGAAWRQALAGQRLRVGDVEIDVVHPTPPDWERPRVRNDDSVVLRIRYGDVEWLLTGDAAGEFERAYALVDDGSGRGRERRWLRLLKVAHHGSRSSSTEPFVAAYRPDIALISVGGSNLFGHPAPDVVARLTGAGADCFRTDLDGAISLETDGRRAHVRTMDGARWEVRLPRVTP